jgi:hypothetical protein
MIEHATAWNPVPDIDDGFGSISFSYDRSNERSALVKLHGARTLSLDFTSVIALQFEDECPGNFPLPRPLPMLRESLTFPLLTIEHSRWLAQWPMWAKLRHYVLISSDELVQLIALRKVRGYWEPSHAA